MLSFVFGEPCASVRAVPGGVRVGVPCPVLSGASEEMFPLGDGVAETAGEWTVLRAPGMTVLAVAATMDDDSVEAVTTRLYEDLFERTRGLHLYRVWHFVPGILNREGGREETYRRFCAARATAFDAAFSGDAVRRMPAATAVGTGGDRLVLVVLAGETVPEHFENPEQTPAYRYPEKYGPRSPSFARATRVRTPAGEWVFISGTAAVRGSESQHPGDFAAQLAVMRENLEVMSRLATRGEPTDFTLLRTYLKSPVAAGAFPGLLAGGTFLHSDICRAELLLESEAVFRLVSPVK